MKNPGTMFHTQGPESSCSPLGKLKSGAARKLLLPASVRDWGWGCMEEPGHSIKKVPENRTRAFEMAQREGLYHIQVGV